MSAPAPKRVRTNAYDKGTVLPVAAAGGAGAEAVEKPRVPAAVAAAGGAGAEVEGAAPNKGWFSKFANAAASAFSGPKIEVSSVNYIIINVPYDSTTSDITSLILEILSNEPVNEGGVIPIREEITIFGRKKFPLKFNINNPLKIYYCDFDIESYGKFIAIPTTWAKKDAFIEEFNKKTGQAGGARRTRRRRNRSKKQRRGKSRSRK